jgi:hypothetical protein
MRPLTCIRKLIVRMQTDRLRNFVSYLNSAMDRRNQTLHLKGLSLLVLVAPNSGVYLFISLCDPHGLHKWRAAADDYGSVRGIPVSLNVSKDRAASSPHLGARS